MRHEKSRALHMEYIALFGELLLILFWDTLTLYSMLTPFDTIEIISYILKYYGKLSICSFGANAPLSIIFSKVFKLNFNFS